jgi:hypothetical protein
MVTRVAPSRVTPFVGGLVLAAGTGAVVGGGYLGQGSTRSLAVLLVLILVCGLAIARLIAPALILCLFAGAIDALPGIAFHAGKPVYVTFGLVFAVAWAGRGKFHVIPKAIWLACGALLIWWLVAVLRAVAIGAPIRATFQFGCDFAVFPILLPACIAAFSHQRLRRWLFVGLGGLACWVALVNCAAALGGVSSAGFFVHAYRATPTGGLYRLYVLSSELPVAVIPFALGATVIGPGLRRRLISVPILVLCVCAVVLGLTRAQYVGLGVMAIIMLALWGIRYLRQTLLLLAAVAALLFAASMIGPAKAPVAAAVSRAESIFNTSADAQGPSGNTLEFREDYERAIRASMSTSDWAIGHGFLPSPWYTFTPDATGSLRNSDLGWYNALNTMGLVGVILVFLPVVLVFGFCWRSRKIDMSNQWLTFGGMGYAIYALTVSQTLVVLFSVYGLAVVSVFLGGACAVALTRENRLVYASGK